MTTEQVLDVRALRLDHRALRAERSRVGWWRRLVRARLDLLVARAVGPQPLGEELAFQLPLDVGLDRLAATVEASLDAPVSDLADTVLFEMLADGSRDDVVLVVKKLHP